MKFMKKVAATALGLTMAFSFGSCSLTDMFGIGGGKDDSDGWQSGGQEETATGEGAKYMEGIVNAIREANTISANMSFNVNFNYADKTYGKEVYDEYYDETYVDEWNDSEAVSAEGNIAVVLAKAGETYSLSLDGTVSFSNIYYEHNYNYDTNSYTAEKITDADTMELKASIVGDMAYLYNPEEDQWYKNPIDWEDVQMDLGIYDTEIPDMLAELYTTFMEGDLTQVYNFLGPIFEQTLMIDIRNQKYEFELSVADDITAAIEYLTTLDYTQTVRAYLDSILVQAETSVEEILSEIAAKGTMTVKEVYDEFNKVLKEETGKDINGLKNEIVAKIDLNQFKDYVDAETFAQISQMYTMISQIKVEEALADFMPLTINDLITMMYSAEGGEGMPETITLDMLTDQILAMLDGMTLEDMLGEDYFEMLTEMQALTFNELSEGISIQFNGYKIRKFDYNYSVDFAYNGTEENVALDADASVSISLSQETTTITAPEGAIEMPSEDEYV